MGVYWYYQNNTKGDEQMYKIYLRTVTQTITEVQHVEDESTTFKSFRSEEKAAAFVKKLKDLGDAKAAERGTLSYYIYKEV